MTLGARVRENPIRALVWIEAAATAMAAAADLCLIVFDPPSAARNAHVYPVTALVTGVCIAAVFAIPHAPSRRYVAIAMACLSLVAVGWLPPPGLLMFVLAAILAARLTFAFGSSGAAAAWLVACLALSTRVYAQIDGAGTSAAGPHGFVAYALAIAPFAILLALIFGIIGLMKVYAASSADAAAASERTRIALDLHDFLGHGLTTLRVQLQNAEHYRSIDSAKADDYVRRAVASSGELLADVRETVGLLHDDVERTTLSFSAMFDRLCADFASTHATVVERRSDVSPGPSGRIAIALYRTIQEALTNVARHASAAHVWVAVGGGETSIEATVEDDGCGIAGAAQPRGHGLLSMRERVTGVGGTLTISARAGGGTVVRAVVPVEAGR
ncbi:MAG TPA: ATP-binding protein [Candidatus Acidoferrales bacterium]|jgi:signal transduction histidine kinase|nr:ATP-binding protein [Candidatus Acidoferrales bacterium]